MSPAPFKSVASTTARSREEPASSGAGEASDFLAELVTEFVDLRNAGQDPSLDDYLRRAGAQAPEFRQLAEALGVMGLALAPQEDSPAQAWQHLVDGQGASIRRLGDYKLLCLLGRGGMGKVFLALQVSLGRLVAVKVHTPRAASGSEDHHRSIEQFRREAQAAAAMHHTNIVPVFQEGEQDGLYYYAMQFIVGQPLNTVLDALRAVRDPGQASSSQLSPNAQARQLAVSLHQGSLENTPRSDWTVTGATARDGYPIGSSKPEYSSTGDTAHSTALPKDLASTALDSGEFYRKMAHLGVQAASALQYAHGRNRVHRDVKPHNFMLDERGTLWLTDFGLVKDVQKTDLLKHAGTWRYKSPEHDTDDVGKSSDIYSLGVMLYEMIVLPDWRQQRNTPAPSRALSPPRQLDVRVPRDLEAIVLKAVEQRPQDRYDSAAALGDDLARFLDGRTVAARPIPWWERLAKWSRRERILAGSIAMVALALVVIALMSWRLYRQELTAKHEAQLAYQRQQQATQRAETSEHKIARDLYPSQMSLAFHAWQTADIKRAADILADSKLWKVGQDDVRGWEWSFLDRALHANWRTLTHSAGAVHAVAFNAESSRIASSDDDGVVYVADPRDGTQLLALRGHTGAVTDLTFSPDGRLLASASHDATVRLWNADDGTPMHILRGHIMPLRAVAFSPDGRQLASAGDDCLVRIWNVHDSTTVQALVTAKPVTDLAFNPAGTRLAGGGEQGAVCLWVTENWSPTKVLASNFEGTSTEQITNVSFTPAGDLLASGVNRAIHVWRMPEGIERFSFQVKPSSGTRGVACHPGGEQFATGGNDGFVKIWNLQGGKHRRTILAHRAGVNAVEYSPNGRWLASAGADGTVKIWDTLDELEARTLVGHRLQLSTVAFSPDGAKLATGAHDQQIGVWDVATGQPLLILGEHEFIYRSNAVPEGNLRQIQTSAGHDSLVSSVAFSPDGQWLASGSFDKTARLWNAETGAQRLKLRHGSPVSSVAFDPQGARLATGCWDDQVRIWDIATGDCLLVLVGHTENVSRVAYSPKGGQLASAGWDGAVHIWDPRTGALLRTLLQTGRVECLAYSSDGKLLASGSDDRSIALWDTATGRQLQSLYCQGRVHDLAFHPDGLRLASRGTLDNPSIQLWDLATGLEIASLAPHSASGGLAFSRDGRKLAVGSNQATACILDATPRPNEGRPSPSLPSIPPNKSIPPIDAAAPTGNLRVLGYYTVPMVRDARQPDQGFVPTNADDRYLVVVLSAPLRHFEPSDEEYQKLVQRALDDPDETPPAARDCTWTYSHRQFSLLTEDGSVLSADLLQTWPTDMGFWTAVISSSTDRRTPNQYQAFAVAWCVDPAKIKPRPLVAPDGSNKSNAGKTQTSGLKVQIDGLQHVEVPQVDLLPVADRLRAEEHYHRAAGYALSAAALGEKTLAERVQRQEIVDLALKQLRQAFRWGFRDLPALQTNPHFDSLRQVPAFQELIKGVRLP